MTTQACRRDSPAMPGLWKSFRTFRPEPEDMQNFKSPCTTRCNSPGNPAASTSGRRTQRPSCSGAAYISRVTEHAEPTGRAVRIPDLLISFDVDRALKRWSDRNGYVTFRTRGSRPDFVLEIASLQHRTPRRTTRTSGMTTLDSGIPEYWRFDPTLGGRHRCGAAIAGDRLVGGIYQASGH